MDSNASKEKESHRAPIKGKGKGKSKGKGKPNQMKQWVRINRKVISRASISRISISSLQESASTRIRVKDPVHNTKAKARASQQSLAGRHASSVQQLGLDL
eukprot:5722597-Amphidinium_carterae.3